MSAVTAHEYGSSQLSSVASRRRTMSGTRRSPGGAGSAGPDPVIVMSVSAVAEVTPRW
jgi:hypothetical protein